MKHVRLLPFILALSVPLAGCDKKPDSRQQADKVVSGILFVHAPSTIEVGHTLEASEVSLDISYSDGTSGQVNADRVSLDTSSTGTKEGIAFYSSFYKTFSIEVVDEGGGGEEDERTFVELKDDVLQNHNYTLDVVSYYVNFPTVRSEGKMYNISDKAYYGTDPNYINLWESGFIKVKDQGIAHFYWSIANQEVSLNYFVVSNPDRGIYDIESALVEFLLESTTLIKADDLHYISTDQDLIGMMATFSGLELSYVLAPDHLDIYKVGNKLKIELILSANYYDEETMDPVENEPVYVGVTINKIGETHNAVIEAFVEDETKKVPNPTYWDSEAQRDFNLYFEGYKPPLPTGATYSLTEFSDWDGNEQKYFIKCQDLASGDLRNSYASQLLAEGFEPEDNVYRKRVQNEDHTLEKIFEAKMKYYAPSAPYAGHTYGYYYVGGVFQVEFTLYTRLIMAVTDVESLNSYIASTAAAAIVPVFPEAYNSSSITKFDDHTETINQLYPGSVLFATSSTGFFRINISDLADAKAFYSELVSRAGAKGFTNVETSAGLTQMLDSADSKIAIADPNSFDSSTYPGYLQCQIYIRDNYTTTYEVDLYGDAGVKKSKVISPTNYYAIQAGTKVIFNFTIENGYELDEVTSNVEGLVITKDTVGVNQYYFYMPNKDVSIVISTKSTAAEEGLEYDKEYAVYYGRTDHQYYYEMPSDQGANKLHFVFHSDGTGTFTYTWINTSGGVNAGPYTVTFTYTLINGAFLITCVDGSENALFISWRLFPSGDAGNYNETGTFNNDEITISLSNGSGQLTEVTLK